jgi:hypothetical protein
MRLAVLAAFVLVAAGFGSAYAAGAFGGGSRPHPATTGVAPPPPDEAELATIRQLVLEASTNLGDPTPTDGVVVPTTRRLAELVDVDTDEPDTPAYFVLVHGAFTDYAARVPKGAEAPTGTLLAVTIDGATNEVLGGGLVGAMPDVNAIGNPEPLELSDKPSTLRPDLPTSPAWAQKCLPRGSQRLGSAPRYVGLTARAAEELDQHRNDLVYAGGGGKCATFDDDVYRTHPIAVVYSTRRLRARGARIIAAVRAVPGWGPGG